MVVSEPTGGCQAVASVYVSLGGPLITHLLDCRDAAKGASSYGATWLDDHLHPVTGCIHADYL
jgi:hypothetical protein